MRDTNQYGQIYKVIAAQEPRKGGNGTAVISRSLRQYQEKTKLSFGGFFQKEGRVISMIASERAFQGSLLSPCVYHTVSSIHSVVV